MNYFRCGDRVQLKIGSVHGAFFEEDQPSGVVVGYASPQSGVPCVLLSMDSKAKDVPRIFTERLVVPMDLVEPL